MGNVHWFLIPSSFDDTEARPSTAPSQNRSNPSVLSSLRTGLEPNRSFDNFPSTKAPTDSNNDNSWLGLKDEPTDEDEEVPPLPPQPVRVAPRVESAVSTLVKKTPLATAQPVPAAVIEPPKKSLFDLLDDDRKQLHEKTILPANVTSTAVKAPDNWLDDRNTTNKRPPAAPLIKPSESQSPMKSSIKSSFDTRNDFGTFLSLVRSRWSRSLCSILSGHHFQRFHLSPRPTKFFGNANQQFDSECSYLFSPTVSIDRSF